MTPYRRISSIVALTLLGGCGGGHGGSHTPQPPANVAPTVNAGADKEVDETTSVTFAGSGADSDGTIASIHWTQTSGASVVLNASDTYGAFFVAPNVTIDTPLAFTLTVTDNQGATASDSLTVNVTPSVWETGVALTSARSGLAACTLNNKVYVFGGAGHETSVEEFDPATQAWTAKADLAVGRRYGHGCATVGTKIYVIGGFTDLPNVDAFDPVANSWTAQAPLPTPRQELAAVTLNGKIYAIGGRGTSPLPTVEMFDPATNTWTKKADLPVGRYAPAAVTLGGKLYVMGGVDSTFSTKMYAYDPAADTWQEVAPMHTARWIHSAAVGNGRIYVFGGQNQTASPALATVEAYDPATDQWTTKADMPNGRQHHAAVAVGNSIYVMGGETASVAPNMPLDSVDLYYPRKSN